MRWFGDWWAYLAKQRFPSAASVWNSGEVRAVSVTLPRGLFATAVSALKGRGWGPRKSAVLPKIVSERRQKTLARSGWSGLLVHPLPIMAEVGAFCSALVVS